MPRTYARAKKEEWLAALAQGKSPKQVANDYKIDERTVKRAASELHSLRAAQEAMTQLYREALRGHVNRLNSALDMIIEELHMPEPYFTELAWHMIASSRLSSRESVEVSEEGRKSIKQAEDVFSDSALLAEHLRNSKAWRVLGDWRRTRSKHRTACGMLQIRSIELLKEMTGLTVREERDVTTRPFLHGENTGDLLCRTVVKYLSGGADIQQVARDIISDEHRSLVLHSGMVLAEGLKGGAKLSECRDSIIRALDNLKEGHEAKQVVSVFQQLEKILPKARYELRAIRVLGVLPGHCRLCRQFGL